jgi:hypothetical protein
MHQLIESTYKKLVSKDSRLRAELNRYKTMVQASNKQLEKVLMMINKLQRGA